MVSCKNNETSSNEEQDGEKPKEELYWNPIIKVSVPDPTAIRIADGSFYMYGTEDTRNMPIYHSTDMVNWTFIGTAFTEETRPKFPAEVSTADANLWAPEIRYINGKYVLFYSLARWGEHWVSTVGYALSDKPEGPFVPKGYVLTSREVGVENSIDQFYYEENGKHYMIWGSFFGLYIAELDVTDDVTITLKKETMKKLAGNAYEGVNIWKQDNYYYIFASIGSCCEGIKSTYETVVARSENLFGPYVNKAGEKMLDNRHEVVLKGSTDNTFKGTGHNSILLEDDAKQTWMIYHAYYKPWATGDNGRSVSMDMVKWANGWPYINDGTPSVSSKVPIIKK